MNNISFPVFKLGSKPMQDGGITFYILGKDTEYSDAEYKVLVVDDKNIPQDALAYRRLALRDKGITMYPLNKAIFFISDMIKLAKPGVWFIDRTGTIFEYKKTSRVPLIYREITKVMPMAAGGAIIEVKGIPSRFKVLHAPTLNETYAGLLSVGNSYILYGLYDQQYDNTSRDI